MTVGSDQVHSLACLHFLVNSPPQFVQTLPKPRLTKGLGLGLGLGLELSTGNDSCDEQQQQQPQSTPASRAGQDFDPNSPHYEATEPLTPDTTSSTASGHSRVSPPLSNDLSLLSGESRYYDKALRTPLPATTIVHA